MINSELHLEDEQVPPLHAELRPEARLLVALARPRLIEGRRELIARFIAAHHADLDWTGFLDLAARHGVLPLVGRNLIHRRLVRTSDSDVKVPHWWLYTYTYEGNRRRNLAVGEEYATVLRALNESGVDHAVRGGPVLLDQLYHDPGARRVGDLDVLVRQDAAPAVDSVAAELGYRKGWPSGNWEFIEPVEPTSPLLEAFNIRYENLPYVKIARRHDVELYFFDPSFDPFPDSLGLTIDAADILDHAVPTTVYGEPTAMFAPVDQIIDMCVRIHAASDLTLLKLLELAETLRSTPAGEYIGLTARARHLGCEGSVHHALHLVARLYPEAAAVPLAAWGTESPPDDHSLARRLFTRESPGPHVVANEPGRT